VESIRDLAADAVKSGRKANGLAIEIADEAGEVLGKITARELFNA
jgi:hypothetical protein